MAVPGACFSTNRPRTSTCAPAHLGPKTSRMRVFGLEVRGRWCQGARVGIGPEPANARAVQVVRSPEPLGIQARVYPIESAAAMAFSSASSRPNSRPAMSTPSVLFWPWW